MICNSGLSCEREALAGKLLHPDLGPFGDFQTFTGSLPIANVIDQFVGMALKSLLAFSGTPNLNSQHGEILYKKRSLRISAPQSVKHKDKKDVKLMLFGILLDLLQHSAVRCGGLEP